MAHTKETFRSLFAKTGNQCAFPGCNHPLVDDDGDFVAQICHIEAAEPKGERYNPAMTDEERRSEKNLVVLCYRHHVKTNNTDIYSAEVLREMKREHESNFGESAFSIREEALDQISKEQNLLYHDIEKINSLWLKEVNEAMEVDVHRDPLHHIFAVRENLGYVVNVLDEIDKVFDELPEDIRELIIQNSQDVKLYDRISSSDNPFYNILWEFRAIGVQNALRRIGVNLKAVEIHILFNTLRMDPDDVDVRKKLTILKEEMLDLAGSACYND
ncbi:hypothetical protein [uncultured Rhodospira sp.]|uniref:hypothetical protein n=1 Tax=uncultured Rhodospira sp. TaxID=1936189 RepID=UPI002603D988|nr:hypothetical protein [uncultured Rhodospira sp.]